MGEPILEPGRQAGICVHDGTEWRKAKGDTDGHLWVQERPFKISIVSWYGTVSAGGTQTLVNVTGAGFLLGASQFMNGATMSCGESRFEVYIDGETSPSIKVRANSYRNDMTKAYGNFTLQAAQSSACPFGWGNLYDETEHIFSGGFALKSHFKTSLKVNWINADPNNATYIDAIVIYAIWQT